MHLSSVIMSYLIFEKERVCSNDLHYRIGGMEKGEKKNMLHKLLSAELRED